MAVYAAGFRSRSQTMPSSSVDIEKRRISSDSNDASPSSSRPMLSHFAPHPKNYTLRYHIPRRRFTRFFACTITSVLLLFAAYLVLSAWNNEINLRLGLKGPPQPPPAWERFPFLQHYYTGIKRLVPRNENKPEFPAASKDEALLLAANRQKAREDAIDPKDGTGFQKRADDAGGVHSGSMPQTIRFDPYPAFGEDGQFEKRVQCFLNASNKAEIPQLLAYSGIPSGFPDPAMGSYEIFGLRDDICFERYGRLGPYGYGYSRVYGGNGAGMEGHREGVEAVWDGGLEVDYRSIDWAHVQERCKEANAHRFRPAVRQLNHFFAAMGAGGPARDDGKTAADADKTKETGRMIGPNGKRLMPRTAVVIRTWKDYKYDEEDLLYLRALINELALQSGTQYVVHFLIHVKDSDLQIWADGEIYQRALNDALPAEFRGLGTLWSEQQMRLIYGGLPDKPHHDLPMYGVPRSSHLPLQYFAHQHPEYDFFWNWEMDIRYTGHFHHLFDKVSQWARQQPMKGLWERNGRFYVPSEHGTWPEFVEMVRKQSEEGVPLTGSMLDRFALGAATQALEYAEAAKPQRPIWGPLRPTGKGDSTAALDDDPLPSEDYDKDNYEWGVGEEADLITFNPLFDPHNTDWIPAEDVTGYNTSESFPPRRAAIGIAGRFTRRMLDVMHRETVFKRHAMFSDMWPGSMALQHGLKAVYAPHPVYVSRQWPTSYLASVLNNGMHGAAGGSRASVFSRDKQHNLQSTTWHAEAVFAPNLWKRWLGYKVNGAGGEEWEMSSSPTVEGQGQGRMCLPAMLLHPVKQVDLVLERKAGE